MLGHRFLRNSKGQVALFVALMFQVLFVFFAMIVNVGLLVHHKINLQNSVDLAAYYGAMKQAEMLNAISHVNYQIRQSFKLITFRYQQLGSAGTVEDPQQRHPYTRAGGQGQILRDADTPLSYEPAFCLPYTPWDIVNPAESYCKNIQSLKVPQPGVPDFGTAGGALGAPFVNFQAPIIALTKDLREKAKRFCKYSMATNWMQLAKYIVAYKIDVRNRKQLLLGLANELSKAEPKDIQGDSIKEGVYKTLVRNLSYPNQEGIKRRFGEKGSGTGDKESDFKFLNSFSVGDCRGNPTDITPPGWLQEIFVFPVYAVFDGVCDNDKMIEFKEGYFNLSAQPAVSPNIQNGYPELLPAATKLATLASEYSTSDPTQLLLRSSLGFEKNPWCLGYVGVSAKTTPKIPFSPLGSVTMTATAYAKPFGGRIGPWYGSVWPSGATESDSAKQMDPMVPTRIKPTIQITGFDPNELRKKHRIFPNHSRYMGDEIGVLSELTVAHYAKAIHDKIRAGGGLSVGWWDEMIEQDFDTKTINGDILAWDKDMRRAPMVRNLEISAISPDQFDTANYSIDPDFYNNYLRKIEKGYGNQFQFSLRGDLGSRMMGSDEEKRFSVRNQIEVLQDPNKNLVDVTGKLTYYLNKFAQVLTAWQQKSPDEYVLDTDRFGKCRDATAEIKQTEDEKFFAGGSCKAGGRTGYSVKLVDGKFLKNEVNGAAQDYELGGKNQVGRIKNPPDDF